MSSSFRQTESKQSVREPSRIRPGVAPRPGRTREQEHQHSAEPSKPGVGKTAEQVAAYYKERSPVVKAANSIKEAIAPNRDFEPDLLECFIGGFLGDSYKVRWEQGKLSYTAYDPSYVEREVVELEPAEEKWDAFWDEMDQLAVWSWQPVYGEHRGDHSTIFSISIEHQGLVVKSTGSDAFPPAGRPLEESEVFSRFCSAISRLTGWLAFR
jgi:hypothetical protein